MIEFHFRAILNLEDDASGLSLPVESPDMSEKQTNPSSSNQLAVSSATNYIGLTKSALDLLSSSNPVTQLAHNIVRWLGRECINESDFTYCIERCSALVYPNEHGLVVRESILQSEKKIARVGGLHLIAAGAIGRWMAFSQDHAYMVTTVAAATKYQGMNFAAKVLCEMVLTDKDGTSSEVTGYYSYSVDRARLMGVLTKVVESISLNVINPGHGLGELPEKLQSFCVHLVDAPTFARTILKISRSSADILLLCDRFQGDLVLWVLAHFEGSIEVSVAGEQVFQRDGLRGKRRFTMIVKVICQDNCREICHRIELSELLKGKWTQTLDGRDDCTRKTSPGRRLPLYSTEPPDYSRRRDILNREEIYQITVLAQRIVLWMMDVPLETNYDFTNVGFEAQFNSEPGASSVRVGDILYRWPGILHDLAGKSSRTISSLPFLPPEPRQSQASDVLYDPNIQTLSALCACFPPISDLLKEVSNRCKCRICRNQGIIDDCKEGCLQEAAMTRLFMLIGNAIADGFGILDTSGMASLVDYVYEVHKLLSELTEGFVWWDTWFNVAASTVLGYSPKGVLGPGYLDEGGSALVAIQYGSNVVAAKWLDLSQKIRVRKCFALEMAEGQIRGVQGQCVFVKSEVKMELSCDLAKAEHQGLDDGLDNWVQRLLEKDQSSLELQQALIGSQDPYSSRLITFVGTGSSQRIVDPADALAGAIRSTFMEPKKIHCQHSTEPDQQTDDPISRISAQDWYVWSFDDLLTNWEIENRATFFTKALDTELKVNVALSLSAQGCVVREIPACLRCALEAVEIYPKDKCRRVISYAIHHQAVVRR